MYILGNVFKVILAFVMVAAVLVAGIFIFTKANNIFGSSNKTHDKVVFIVKPGDSVSTIGQNLKDAGVLDKSGLIDPVDQFKLEIKRRSVEQKLNAGRFELTTNMDIGDLVSTLTSAPVLTGIKVQVIEGKRLEEIADELGAKNIISPTHFLALTKNADQSAVFQDDFLASAQRPGDQGLEGYLFPDTYQVDNKEGDNSELIIKTMLQGMEAKFTPDMRQAAADKKRSIHQILTIASIVQREAAHNEEMPLIASVYWNRLDQDMLLNADPTLQYGAGQAPNWWKVIDFDPVSEDSTYNTYTNHGLPPGPICGSGEAAIKAAVYPDPDSKYLYFVAKKDKSGYHVFAKTLEEHTRNEIEQGYLQP